ncbi:pilus assembly protein [Hyphococcus flavus]|uniref:Pilus assembly protein n=1 Tax=Hyphococcus flavus TaxID=1866326 RepID=A0AAF0CGV8_9PROT|nr:TadE/TadG family type IV pilus assembly protein [Hyphococcus flavus]WDI31167.1 pilus assembly protein [Hyphococcus flavus]
MSKAMGHRNKSLLKEWRRCQSGLAATEFAMLLPVLVIMFFGLVEASDAMTVNRKVAISANTLADLAAQSEQLYISDIDDLFEGVMAIVEPHDPNGMQLKLVSVVLDADDDPVVHWSRDHAGGIPYAEGAAYTNLSDDDVVSSSSSIIVVEMVYNYSPSLTSHVIEAPLVFNRQSIRWPRVTNRVQLCDDQDNCTT